MKNQQVDAFQDLYFPTKGIDLSLAYNMQPVGTTETGVNVRAFDQPYQRARGGSREGITRYIAATVSGVNKIQHVNFVVDPQAEATELDEDDEDSTNTANYLNDPSTNNFKTRIPTGRRVRRGGSGRSPGKDRKKKLPMTMVDHLADRDMGTAQYLTSNPFPVGTVYLINPAIVSTKGNLIVVAIAMLGNAPAATVTDAIGNTYTLAASITRAGLLSGNPSTLYCALYWAVAKASGSNLCTVTRTVSSIAVAVAEFRGLKSIGPIDSAVTSSGSTASLTTGNIPTATAGSLVIGAFAEDDTNDAIPDGYDSFSGLNSYPAIDLFAYHNSAPRTISYTAGSSRNYAAVGVSFRPFFPGPKNPSGVGKINPGAGISGLRGA